MEDRHRMRVMLLIFPSSIKVPYAGGMRVTRDDEVAIYVDTRDLDFRDQP